jgi:hypothetical protein
LNPREFNPNIAKAYAARIQNPARPAGRMNANRPKREFDGTIRLALAGCNFLDADTVSRITTLTRSGAARALRRLTKAGELRVVRIGQKGRNKGATLYSLA